MSETNSWDDYKKDFTLHDVYLARKTLSKYITRTPLINPKALSKLLECDVYVKVENVLPTGSFKARGALNLVSQLSEEDKKRGVITYDHNNGNSLAYAASVFGIKAVIGAIPGISESGDLKTDVAKNYGAAVVLAGNDHYEAKDWVEKETKLKGYKYILADDGRLIAGTGTLYLEIMEDLPDADIIIAPIGSGTGVSAACLVCKTINPKVKVIGVQSESSPGAYLSWKSQKLVETETSGTFAEGLGTKGPFPVPWSIFGKAIDEVVLVSDEEIKRGMLTYIQTTHVVAEGAPGAALAAAYKIRKKLKGKKVVLVLTGGTVDLNFLNGIFKDNLKKF